MFSSKNTYRYAQNLKHVLLSSFSFRTGGADNFFHCDKCGNFLRELLSAMILHVTCSATRISPTLSRAALVVIWQGVATATSWRILTAAWKEQCITTALSASRWEAWATSYFIVHSKGKKRNHSELCSSWSWEKFLLSSFTVSVRLHERHQRAAVRAHDSSGVHERDESAPSVSSSHSSLQRPDQTTWPDTFHPLPASNDLKPFWLWSLQLLVPCVLEVRLRHDRHVAEARRGGRGNADAGDLPDEDGKQQTGCSPSEIPPSHRTPASFASCNPRPVLNLMMRLVWCRSLKLNAVFAMIGCRCGSCATTAARCRACGSTCWGRSAPCAAPTTPGRRGHVEQRPQHRRRGGSVQSKPEASMSVHQLLHHGPGCSL